jgi:hypothetical protein
MVLEVEDSKPKSSMLSGLNSGISSPEVLGKAVVGDSFLSLNRLKGKKKVKASEKALEIDKSNKAFEELKINGVKLFLLNELDAVMSTTSKMCGDGEYMFVLAEGVARMWRGGTSVFEDGDNVILFHRPHIAVDISGGENHLKLVTQIREFEFDKVYKILKAIDSASAK